jgi:hypothetical protein
MTAAVRKAKVLELKLLGLTTQEIATEIGVTRQHAWRLLDGVLEETKAEYTDRADEYRAIQAARIEEDIRRLRPLAHEGDSAAQRTVVRLYERQAKLLNLDLRPVEAEGAVFNVILPEWAVSSPDVAGTIALEAENAEVAGFEVVDGEEVDAG